jgi:hypothetical protein
VRQDEQVQEQARSVLSGLFRNIGEANSDGGSASALGGLGGELAEFITMPADLARIFMDMSMDLTEMVLTSLAEAGIVLVRGLTPA